MKNNNYTGSTVISLFIHALLIGLLLWGADFTKKKSDVGGNTIQAVVVDPAMIHQQATQIKEQREAAKRAESAEQERKKKQEEQAEALEKQRKDEAERARQLKADQLKAEKEAREAEKQRKLVAEQQKQAAEEKRKADEAAKVAKAQAAKAEAERKAKQEAAEKAEQVRQQKLEEQRKAEEASRQAELERQKQEAAKKKAQEEAAAEVKRKEAEAKKKAEAEAKRKAAEAKKKAEAEAKKLQQQKEAALNDMFAGLEAESEQRGGAKGKHIADEVARYGAIYKQMIQQNLLVDQSFKGQECNLSMRLSADGLVLDVTQSNGDGALCRAAKSAVVKVSQFPMPDDPEIAKKLRNIKLTVTPQ